MMKCSSTLGRMLIKERASQLTVPSALNSPTLTGLKQLSLYIFFCGNLHKWTVFKVTSAACLPRRNVMTCNESHCPFLYLPYTSPPPALLSPAMCAGIPAPDLTLTADFLMPSHPLCPSCLSHPCLFISPDPPHPSPLWPSAPWRWNALESCPKPA